MRYHHFQLSKKTFLELGAGSGLISVYASRRDAIVTATNINPIAIKTLVKNRLLNKVDFEVLQSDLFNALSGKQFDMIAVTDESFIPESL